MSPASAPDRTGAGTRTTMCGRAGDSAPTVEATRRLLPTRAHRGAAPLAVGVVLFLVALLLAACASGRPNPGPIPTVPRPTVTFPNDPTPSVTVTTSLTDGSPASTTPAPTVPTTQGDTRGTSVSIGSGGGAGNGDGTNTAAVLLGSWLGPEPGFNQGQCSNGTTVYTFSGDGSWFGHNVNLDPCGGTFTIGGTYSLRGSALMLHFTTCPEGCAQFGDTTETVSFIDNNDFSMSDQSFDGTYHRQ